MQTLWSRVIQARSSCRCPTCLTNPQKALARRVATAPVGRHLRPSDVVSTILFSATVASGAALDARNKKTRREELDGILISSKEELQAFGADHARRLEALGLDIDGKSMESVEVLGNNTLATGVSSKSSPLRSSRVERDVTTSHPEEALLEDVERSHLAWSSDKDSSTKRSAPRSRNVSRHVRSNQEQRKSRSNKTLRKPKSTIGRRDSLNGMRDRTLLSPTMLADHIFDSINVDSSIGRSYEECWEMSSTPEQSPATVLQRQTAMSILIHRIVVFCLQKVESFEISLPHGQGRKFTRNDVKSIRQTIRELEFSRLGVISSAKKSKLITEHMEPLSFPPYQWAARGKDTVQRGLEAQERQLLDIFAEHLPLDELLSRLCSALACHRFAPNIRLFNIILIKLSHLQAQHIARYVIEAMMQSSISANEVTHTAVLNCYEDTIESSKFSGYVNLMDCVPGHGLVRENDGPIVAAKPSDCHTDLTYQPMAHALTGFDLQTPRTRYVRVPRTQGIFEALISGFLKFRNIRRALIEYSRMTRSRLEPTIEIYKSFLRYCVDTKAWTIGWRMWVQLNTEQHSLDSVIYYWMLQLCASCGKVQEYRTVMNSAVNQGAIPHHLKISYFRMGSKDFKKMLEISAAIQRLRRDMEIPEHQTECPTIPAFESHCPANLYSMLVEEFQSLVHWKWSTLGHSMNFYVLYTASSYLPKKGLSTQWVSNSESDSRTVVSSRLALLGVDVPERIKPSGPPKHKDLSANTHSKDVIDTWSPPLQTGYAI